MANFFYNQLFIQALGVVAFIFGVWAFSCKDDVRLKKLTIAYCAVLIPHYQLLGASGATVAIFLAAVRTYASLYKKLKQTAPFFIILYFVLGFYYYETWVDILPIAGSAMTTFGLFYLQKIPMRLCCAFSSVLWLVHNAVVMSIAPFFMEAFLLGANTLTIYRLYKNENG